MSLLTRIFGSWHVIREGTATAKYGSVLTGKEWSEQVGITVERHTRTKKERAFIHHLNGTKQNISLSIVNSLTPRDEP